MDNGEPSNLNISCLSIKRVSFRPRKENDESVVLSIRKDHMDRTSSPDEGVPDGGSSVVAAVQALAPCTACILSVHEGDCGRSRILEAARVATDPARAILAFNPQSDPGAVVYDASITRVVHARLLLDHGQGSAAETVELLSGGSVVQIVLDRQGKRTWLLTLFRKRSQDDFSKQETALLTGIGPSLRMIWRQEQEARRGAAMLSRVEALLDHVAFGVLIIDADRRVLWSNAAAGDVLSSCEVLDHVGSRFKAVEPRQDLRLREILYEIAKAPPGLSRATSIMRDDEPPLQLGFVRLPASDDEVAPVIAVFLSHSFVTDISAPFLRELYGLTPVEAGIARSICQGLTPAATADRLGLSIHTVRDYLKPIFNKMGVHRQVDMVRVAATFGGLLQGAKAGRPSLKPELAHPGGKSKPSG